MEEQWKDIIGYEGLYQISNLGSVKSLKYGKERILKPIKKKDGYLTVVLYNGVEKKMYIHRLVAINFIPNENNLQEINHKDENKDNNCVKNLEWTDHITNMQYGTLVERSAKARLNHPKLSKQVNQYSKDGKTLIKTFPSAYEIQRQLGFNQSHICDCCNGKQKTAHNYIWKYVE